MEDAHQEDLEFLAKVSHELRGPLHSILGLSEMLVDGGATDNSRLSLAINREAKSLQVLVDDLLDYARIASDRLELMVAPFPLVDVVGGIIASARPSAAAKGLTLLLTVGPEVPHWVEGDEVRFTQIVRNLVTNSIRYSDSGGIAVALSAATSPAVRCVIADEGIGIPPESLPTLFEPFTQAHQKRAGGSGLGLAVCARLTELMSGKLSVTSEVGVGSVFTVDVELATTSAPKSERVRARPTRGAGQNVLVVEDSPVNQLLARTQIQKLGMDPTIAESGEEAISILNDPDRDVFDVILMDWNLPGITGLETSEHIRTEGLVDASIPIIAMTANALTGDRERCIEAGMNDFLPKPVSSADMTAMLTKWVSAPVQDILTTPRHNKSVDSTTLDDLEAEFGDPAVIETLIRTFLDELPGRIESIVEGHSSGNLEAIKRGAHTLGSTSALLGAHGVSDICNALRDTAGVDEAEPFVRRIQLEAQDVADVLNIRLNQQGESS